MKFSVYDDAEINKDTGGFEIAFPVHLLMV